MRLMTSGLFVRVLCISLSLFLALFIGRRRLRRLSRMMSKDLDSLLNRRTLADKQRCDKLLGGIEGCMAIADKALSSPARTQDLQRALGDISTLLAQTLVG